MNQHNRETFKISEQLKTHFIYPEALFQLIYCFLKTKALGLKIILKTEEKILKEASDCKITTFIEKEAFETEVLEALLKEKEMLIKDQKKRSQITFMK